MKCRIAALLTSCWYIGCFSLPVTAEDLSVGFAEVDITPDPTGPHPVWLAGYGHGRRATGVHDPLSARCVVLRHGADRIACLSVDLVGLQYPEVQRIRARFPGYRYVLIASTHNHEGPDVVGIWGQTPLQRGVDDDYLKLVVERCGDAIESAERKLVIARVEYGMAADESLLDDNREPYVKDGVLRVLKFVASSEERPIGAMVQWSCHPESLGSRNTLVTADFPHFVIQSLREEIHCPIVYFSGAVGGLMTNPDGKFRDAEGKVLADGNFEYARQYGAAVAALASRALRSTEPARATPFAVCAKKVDVPVENQLYRAAQEIGVLARAGKEWREAGALGGAFSAVAGERRLSAVETEVAFLRLGEIHIAGIPGELYPELVYGKVQSPADPGADYPDAAAEPSVVATLPGSKWLLIGLANDEIGYIIPRRQWDEKPPFCYGRKRAQYGEVNSCGPQVAPIVMRALAECVADAALSR